MMVCRRLQGISLIRWVSGQGIMERGGQVRMLLILFNRIKSKVGLRITCCLLSCWGLIINTDAAKNPPKASLRLGISTG